jgi:3-hydroxybutyryl-CoA dehydrogenase
MPPEASSVKTMTCGHTNPAVVEFLTKVMEPVGFIPMHVKGEPKGFIFNRICAAIKRESLQAIREGAASPEGIDTIFASIFGAKVGICELIDRVGSDTVYNTEKLYVEERSLMAPRWTG